jgi:hypothetical protein
LNQKNHARRKKVNLQQAIEKAREWCDEHPEHTPITHVSASWNFWTGHFSEPELDESGLWDSGWCIHIGKNTTTHNECFETGITGIKAIENNGEWVVIDTGIPCKEEEDDPDC